MQGMSQVPSHPNTLNFSGNMRNSPLENMLRTLDTQSKGAPPTMPCQMDVARDILIKSALQQIGRELGVVM